MTDTEYFKAVIEATDRVHAMDIMDGRKDRDISTIAATLNAGIRNPASGAQFDALVMLLDLEAQRKAKG